MTDQELLQCIAQKDPTAFREWYDRHSGALYRYLVRLLGDAHAAEDVLSEAMFAVWTDARRFRGECHPRTWLYRIARNKAVEWLRRRPEVAFALEDGADPVQERDHERADLRVALGQALAGLPREQREVVTLAFFHGLSYEEVARVVGCPVNTVKTRMFWAKRKLREALERGDQERERARGDGG